MNQIIVTMPPGHPEASGESGVKLITVVDNFLNLETTVEIHQSKLTDGGQVTTCYV